MVLYVISYVITCRDQDCVVVILPYPNNPNPVELFNVETNFNLQGDGLLWYTACCGILRLFFKCTLCQTCAKASMHSSLHKEVSLVYFSTFRPNDMTPDSIMQRDGVPMLYG